MLAVIVKAMHTQTSIMISLTAAHTPAIERKRSGASSSLLYHAQLALCSTDELILGNPHRCVVIEDSRIGMLAAKAAGMT